MKSLPNSLVLLALLPASFAIGNGQNENRIRPCELNPRYWQYKKHPVLLLGGSKDDSLFQIPDLKKHLDEIHAAGANYIRNTMSDRPDHDFEVYAFKQLPSGKYDLDQWNEEYWMRFENLLKWTEERDIIVQLELWDRFDFADHGGRRRWVKHPYNPLNNVNYTAAESGMVESYTLHPSADKQPFFHTVPGMDQYESRFDRVRQYQERYVAKLLSYSLRYGNVLYCMDNETTTNPRWGQYWMQFIRNHAATVGVDVYVTDMFDDVFNPQESEHLRMQLDSPEQYPFLDISQVNSRTFNEDHWNNVTWIAQQLRDNPRPLNHTKIYSAGQKAHGTGTPQDGVERFWRNLIAGCAACRFHRPTSGIGINDTAKACIAAARKAETVVKFWDLKSRLDLLSDREEDEAYLAAELGQKYLLYFTDGGSVSLDLSDASDTLHASWININSGDWGTSQLVQGGGVRTFNAPDLGGWAAVITVDRAQR